LFVVCPFKSLCPLGSFSEIVRLLSVSVSGSDFFDNLGTGFLALAQAQEKLKFDSVNQTIIVDIDDPQYGYYFGLPQENFAPAEKILQVFEIQCTSFFVVNKFKHVGSGENALDL